MALRRDAERHHHHFPRVGLGVDEDHGEPLVIETPLRELSYLVGAGSHKTATDARLLHAESCTCQVDNLLVTPRRNPVDEMIQGGLGHGVRRLQERVTLQLRFASLVGVTHPRLAKRGLLAGDGHIAPLMAEPSQLAVGPALMPLAATLRDLVLQQTLGHQQTHLRGERRQRLPRHLHERFHIERKLHLPGRRLGLLLDLAAPARLARAGSLAGTDRLARTD